MEGARERRIDSDILRSKFTGLQHAESELETLTRVVKTLTDQIDVMSHNMIEQDHSFRRMFEELHTLRMKLS